MKKKFVHVRKHNEKKEPLSRGGVTFCYTFNPETGDGNYSFSRCSDKDNFNKKRARLIATNRMDHNSRSHIFSFKGEVNAKNKKVIDSIVTSLSTELAYATNELKTKIFIEQEAGDVGKSEKEKAYDKVNELKQVHELVSQ